MDAELRRLRRPTRVRAQAGDPVDWLRRLPEPRIATDLHGRLPRAHPRVVGVGLLRLERAAPALPLGDGVPGAEQSREPGGVTTHTKRGALREVRGAVAGHAGFGSSECA